MVGLAVLLFFISLGCTSGEIVVDEGNGVGDYKVEWKTGLKIKSFDGTILVADAFVPIPQQVNETFPILIFPNSWGVPQFEYVLKALQWGERGYIMLEYETRGWYESGGVIGTAGPDDQKDLSQVIDFVLNQTSWYPDPNNIGFAGISYGGGLSLLAAERDTRVKTAIALSGWGDILSATDPANTTNLFWDDVLMLIGEIVGREPPDLKELLKYLKSGTNTSYVRSYCAQRSPATFLEKINSRNVPIFISNNFEDRIFRPNYQLDFYQQIQSPKMILLNQGIHATAELGGLLDLPNNFVWQKVGLWADYWLKGKQTGIMDEPSLQFQLRNDFSQRELFKTWPSPSVESRKFYLNYRGTKRQSSLTTSSPVFNASDTISYSTITGLSAGIPVIGELFQVYVDIPITAEMGLVSYEHAIIYNTEPLTSKTRVCGTPNITLHTSNNKDKYQLVAYLYDVDALLGIGTLISHGPWTKWNATASEVYTATIPMRSLCVDVPKGHHIALAFDLYSDLFYPVSTSGLDVSFHYFSSSLSSFFELPVKVE